MPKSQPEETIIATQLTFRLESQAGPETRNVEIRDLVIAGWTGRDKEATEKHIAELEAIGVSRPPTTPCFYRGSANLLTTDVNIQVVGADSSGEVEFVLVAIEDGLWVGTGSDHTDRRVETYDVAVSKQMCAKPIAPVLWRYEELSDHWDDLVLRSHATVGGERRLYQEGPVTTMITPETLMALYEPETKTLAPGTLMYCGTLAVVGSVKPADVFEIELHDPVLGRTISHGYEISALPAVT